MPSIRTIPLKGLVPDVGPIEFLRAEMASGVGRYIPFALVRYALHGKEQPLGIRLDLDKRAFLDNPEDVGAKEALDSVAPQIVGLVGRKAAPASTRRRRS
jgi:hypothetical protein